ncbi:MAG: Sec-independent protein translocase protein TatB [Tabrizicola sp.]|jgi:sec-independent protein translocase protein TatB|nr:Sec-independent protein translocase protein TatB [Tabrizicola sp.]
MDLSWSELLVIGIVALIIIGPKDLPGMFRELGRFTAKLRSMGREFSRAMEAAAKESGVQDVADDLRKVANPKAMGLDAVKSAADKFEKWDPLKPAAKPAAAPLTPPPMPPVATPAAAAGAVAAAPAAAPAAGAATAALAEEVAAKRAASAEKAAQLREAKAAPVAAQKAEPVEAAVKRGGRVRKKPDAGMGDEE